MTPRLQRLIFAALIITGIALWIALANALGIPLCDPAITLEECRS